MNIVTIDFETYYDKDYSLSKLTTESYIRDARFETIGVGYQIGDAEPQWFSDDERHTKQFLESLQLQDKYLLAHNMAFDGAILHWRYGIKPKYYLDTLSMARPVTGATVGGSLAALAKRFNLGEKGTEVVRAVGKRRRDFTATELAEYGKYCMNDTQLCYLLFHVLRQWSTPRELYLIDLMLRMFIDPVMELDRQVLTAHLQSVIARKEELLSRLNDGDKARLASNPQFVQMLEELDVEPPMKISPRTGKPTYALAKNDPQFKALLEHEDLRVQTLVAARLGVKSTIEETRTQRFLEIGSRGALPILLNYYGAHTGRASGGDKINLQNLRRGGELRKAVLAPPGHVVVACDSSQIEARIVAWLAGQTDLVEAFAKGEDIYSRFASTVYGRPIDRKRKEIDANGKEFYPDFVPGFVGKTCILGLGFGMGAKKFQHTLKVGAGGVPVVVDQPEAERIVGLYRQTYPAIPALWKQARDALNIMLTGGETTVGVGIELRCTNEGVHLPNGMMIRYPNLRRFEDKIYYDSRSGPVAIYGAKMIENIVQALARIVVFEQMAKIDQQLRKMDGAVRRYRTVLTVHDEVVCCVPEDYGPQCEQLMLETMRTPPVWASSLPLAAEAGIGKSYGDCK